MKVDKKQIPLVLGLLAVLAAVLVYFLVYQKYQEKLVAVDAANVKLQSQIDDLNVKSSSRQMYEEAILEMDAGIQKVYNLFPPAIEEEDAVMEALRLEALAPMRVNNLDFQDPITLYTVGQGSTGETAAPAPTDEATGETTLEEDVAAAQAGETTNYGEFQVPDLQFSTGMLPAGYEGEFGPISLNVNTVNTSFVTSYQGFKRTLDYFTNNPSRRTIQNISLAFSEETGLINVSSIVSEYSITGTGKAYVYPTLPSVPIGTSNIFGTAEFAEGDFLEYLVNSINNYQPGEGGENEEDADEEATENAANGGTTTNNAGRTAKAVANKTNEAAKVVQPTEAAATNNAATTNAATTNAATTNAATTNAVAADAATTNAATTNAVAADAATTNAVAADAATTEAQTTEAPTTEASTTDTAAAETAAAQ